MGIIYEPRGPAAEYSPLAANLWKGCTHGCRYCYAPAATFTDRAKFHGAATPRPNVLEQLRKEVPKFAGDPRRILLSFTSDPYQPEEVTECLTRQALRILLDPRFGLRVAILTKGGLLSARDFDLLSAHRDRVEYGATLTYMRDRDTLEIEPNAALPGDRLDALKEAHDRGIPTWASLEPVMDPEQSIRLIQCSFQYTDHFKIGKLNHMPEIERQIDWRAFRTEAEKFLKAVGFKRRMQPHVDNPKRTYYLKRDLVRATE